MYDSATQEYFNGTEGIFIRTVKSRLKSELEKFLGTEQMSDEFFDFLIRDKEGYVFESENKQTVIFESVIYFIVSFVFLYRGLPSSV